MLHEIKDFIVSWTSIFGVIKFLFNSPKSLLWIVIPLIINIVVMLASLYLAFVVMETFFPISWPALEFTLISMRALAEALASNTINLLFTMGCFLSIYILSFSIFCSFTYGLMVEKIEKKLGVEPNEFESLSIWRQITDSLLIACLFLIGNIVILSFNIVPVVGTIIALISAVVFQSFCLGMEFFDFSMALRGKSLKDKIIYFKAHPGEVLGVGNISWLFMMIPLLNSCLFTLSILAATFRYRKRRIKTKFSEVFTSNQVSLMTDGYDALFSVAQLSKQGNFYGTSDQLSKLGNELVYLARCDHESVLIQWTASGEIIRQKSTVPV